MKVLFLCGAGASKFGGPCLPASPPLGAGGELFRALQARRGMASTITGTMAATFERDFEQGMAAFMADREPDVTALLREMGFYFLQFQPGPNHSYRRLIRICRANDVEPVFATTNYDVLIEHCIRAEGFRVHLGEDAVPPRSLTVLKLHGSSNWIVRPPPGITMIGCHVTGTKEYFGGMHVSAEWPEQAIPMLFQYPDFAPSMSLYAVGKRVLYSGEMVLQSQAFFSRVLRVADRVYVIGLRVNPADEHIWHPLANSAKWVGYVGREPSDFSAWAKNASGMTEVVAETFEAALNVISSHLASAS